MKEVNLQIRISEQLRKELIKYSKAKGMNMSEAARYIIQKEIDNHNNS